MKLVPAICIGGDHLFYEGDPGDRMYFVKRGLLQVLKCASDLFSSITAYQVTDKGQQIVDRLSKIDKGPVNELVYAPGTKNLMMVTWVMDTTVTDGTGGTFVLVDQTAPGATSTPRVSPRPRT